MIISEPAKPLYVYLQRPDTGEWVVVGRYRLLAETGPGIFRYADSYREAGFTWSIDPVNLPFTEGGRSGDRLVQETKYRCACNAKITAARCLRR